MSNNEKITTEAINQLLNYYRENNEPLLTSAPLCISYTSDEKQILGMVTGLGIPNQKGGFFYHIIDDYFFYLRIYPKAKKEIFCIVTTLPESIKDVLKEICNIPPINGQ